MSKKYLAEFVGTFALSFIVLAAVVQAGPLPVAVPVLAALTLGLFVYTIGSISGCHLNPAVTVGLWSVKKISNRDAVLYILAQIFAASVAIAAARAFGLGNPVSAGMVLDWSKFAAETLGMFFFTFGIAAVVYGRVKSELSGIVIGGSLLLGIMVAVAAGSSGILNPAVAFALNSLSTVYIVAPVLGSALGFGLFKYLVKEK